MIRSDYMSYIVAVDLFDTDEQVYLNSFSDGVLLSELTRERVLKQLNMAEAITNDENTQVLGLIQGITSKISVLTDVEWRNIVVDLPFSLLYESSDEPVFDEDTIA